MDLLMASSPPVPAAPMTGAVLSRVWRLANKLGEGGMGEVYAAASTSGGSRVAIKLLRREFLSDHDLRSRFLEEARTCMRLVHPNIVRVLECAQAEDGSPYFVMELLDGVPLGAYMQNGARVPVAQAAPIILAILSGLAAAHSHGVVHRDLKPDNVILTRDSSGSFVVKLLDFGIAKVMDAAGGMGSRTRTGILLGTPAYMSPEQARSARDVDQRADLWSVGVLFYEMLTGRVAFPAPTEYARLAALLSTEPEPLERVDPALAPLAPFVERALKKNRDERFATAADMAHALIALVPPAPPRGETGRGVLALVPLLPLVTGSTAPVFTKHSTPDPTSAFAPAQPNVEWVRPPSPGVGGKRDGTLASRRARTGSHPPQHQAPQVLLLDSPPFGESPPSTDRDSDPRFSAAGFLTRGVPPVLVALLIVAALLAGIALGWIFSRWQ